MAKIVHPALGRGLVQAHVAKHFLKLGLKLGSQPKDQDLKEKAIERAAKDLGDADFDRTRQVANYFCNPKHAKNRSLQEMADRLRAKAAKAPAKKVVAKKATKAKRTSRPVSTGQEGHAVAA